MNTNLKQGRTWLQVADCFEGKSQSSGNEYWCLKCQILPDPKVGRQSGEPLESFNVYFVKKYDWVLQNLQDIVHVCGTDKPWNLYGKRFIANVTIKNNFVSLKDPHPYTEVEETIPPDINDESERPF